MSSGWIKYDKDMVDDPRVLSAAHALCARYIIAKTRTGRGGTDLTDVELLRFACNAVTGALVTLFKFADEHIRDDDTLDMSREALDSMLGITDFFDLMPPEWLDELDDGTLILPGYCEKNHLVTKRKAALKSKARVAAYRARQKVNGNGVGNEHVTQPSMRYTSVTKVVDQDQDQNKKKEKIYKKEKGTRLPEDFVLSADLIDYAKGLALDPAAQLAAFRDHWFASSQPNAVKRDWAAAFRSWCRSPYQKPALSRIVPTPAGSAPEVVRNSAAWVELLAAGRACDFREPYRLESETAYADELRRHKNRAPPSDLSHAIAAKLHR